MTGANGEVSVICLSNSPPYLFVTYYKPHYLEGKQVLWVPPRTSFIQLTCITAVLVAVAATESGSKVEKVDGGE